MVTDAWLLPLMQDIEGLDSQNRKPLVRDAGWIAFILCPFKVAACVLPLLHSKTPASLSREANLFFLNARVFAMTDNVGTYFEQLSQVVDHVRTQYPFFNRSGGADHFVWTPADEGACNR